MRVQLSLNIDDEELIEGLIEPFKQCRYLNKLIIKCLSAYYRDKQVRQMIESTSIDDIESKIDRLKEENQVLKQQLNYFEEEKARYLGKTDDFGLC